MNQSTRKANEAVLDAQMTEAGHEYVKTKVNDDGSSTVTYVTSDGKQVRVEVSGSISAQPGPRGSSA